MKSRLSAPASASWLEGGCGASAQTSTWKVSTSAPYSRVFNDVATTLRVLDDCDLLLVAPSGISFGDEGVDCELLETMFSLGNAQGMLTVERAPFISCAGLNDTTLRFNISSSSGVD